MSKWTLELLLFLFVAVFLGAPIGQPRAKGWFRVGGLVLLLAAASTFGLGASAFVLKFAAGAILVGAALIFGLHILRGRAR
jgi:hypothetical protein